MLHIRLLTGFCMLLSTAAANKPVAQLQVTVRNEAYKKIEIIKPLDNVFFWAAKQSLYLDSVGTTTITFDSTETGYVMLFVQGKRIKLLINQTNSISLLIDTSASVPLTFKGSNAAGQALLNDKKFPEFYYNLQPLFRKDTTLKLYMSHVEDDKAEKRSWVNLMLNNKGIDKNFYEQVCLNLDYLYATVLIEKIRSKFYELAHTATKSKSSISLSKDYAEAWEDVLLKYPPANHSAISTTALENYIDAYIDVYLTDYARWIKQDTLKLNYNDYLQKKWDVIEGNFSGKLLELTKARRLYLAYIQKKYEKTLISMYEAFSAKTTFKKSLRYLKQYHEDVLAYHITDKQGFKENHVFVKNYSKINDFKTLIQELKGRYYYVDIWATWCSPCKQEFKYKDELNAFFSENNIQTIYISMDNPDFDAEWKKMIKFYNLEGLHIRANEALRENLSKTFWDGNGYAIPRYLFIGADGSILESNALRPSNLEKLKAQLKKHLK